ncbi:MAG TPA: signal peptidase I [Clostridia bacterium]|nr:signal peptidase I [Clostridia bacterium]
MPKEESVIKKLIGKVKPGAKKPGASDKQAKHSPSFIALTVIGILLCVVLIPVFIFNLTLTIKGAVNKDKVPTIFGIAPLIVLSDSMSPTIREKDLIFIKEVDAGDLKEQDVIAYKYYPSRNNRDDWKVVTHRIVNIYNVDGEIKYRTKGDDSGLDTYLVSQSDVVGIYTGARLSKIGKLLSLMQEPLGMAIVIGIPVVLFIGLDVLRRYLYTRKQAAAPEGETAAIIASKEQELEAVKAELERLKAAKADAMHTGNAEATDTKDGAKEKQKKG